MNLLLFEAGELEGARATLAGPRAAHLRDVLGVQVGSVVRAGLVDGGVGTATVEALEGDEIRVCVDLGATPTRPAVDLLLALPRPKVMGRLWSALAQLGVGRILLTQAAKVERFYFDAHQLDPARRREHLLEGLAQARDTRVPIVTVHRSFRRLLEVELDALVAPTEAARLVAHPGDAPSPRDAACALPLDRRAILAVGPEGGWTDDELAQLGARGFSPVGLGPRTLRTDTAITVLLGLVHDGLRARVGASGAAADHGDDGAQPDTR